MNIDLKIMDSLTSIIEMQQQHIAILNVQINNMIDIVKKAPHSIEASTKIDERKMKSMLNLNSEDPVISAMQDVSQAKIATDWSVQKSKD